MLSLQKFLDETPLHGFLYANDKRHLFVALWTLLSAACVALAANDIAALVQNYQSIPVIAVVAAEQNNNVTLPTPTLCMEVMLIPPSRIIYPQDVVSDIQTFMYNTANGTNHMSYSSSTEMGLSENLEYLTYMMLGYMTDSEMLYIRPNNQLYADYATRYTAANPNNWKLMQLTFDTYAQYGVSLVNLKLLVGTSVCRKQYEQAQKGRLQMGSQGPLHICQPDTLTHLSFSLVCSKLFHTETFNTGDCHSISFASMVSASNPDKTRGQTFPPVIMNQMCQPQPYATTVYTRTLTNVGIAIGTDGSVANLVRYLWHLDLQGRPVIPTDSLYDITTIDPQIPTQMFDIFVVNEFNFNDVPIVRPCVTEETRYQCRWRKLVDRLSQMCGCWPSTLIGLTNTKTLPPCSKNPSFNPFEGSTNTSSDNVRCDSGLDTAVDDAECPRECKSFHYSSRTVDAYRHVNLSAMTTPYPGDLTTGSFEVTWQVRSFRTRFKEESTMSFTVAASAFGGIIGTWLG